MYKDSLVDSCEFFDDTFTIHEPDFNIDPQWNLELDLESMCIACRYGRVV